MDEARRKAIRAFKLRQARYLFGGRPYRNEKVVLEDNLNYWASHGQFPPGTRGRVWTVLHEELRWLAMVFSPA